MPGNAESTVGERKKWVREKNNEGDPRTRSTGYYYEVYLLSSQLYVAVSNKRII
jgi:hypothetical protein